MTTRSIFLSFLLCATPASAALAQAGGQGSTTSNAPSPKGKPALDPAKSMNPAVRYNTGSTTPKRGQVGMPLQPGDIGYDPAIDRPKNR